MIHLFAASEVVQVSKFGAVGIINTLIDFGIFNVLSTKRVGLTKIKANIVSTTIAMLFSFFANQIFVFEAQGGSLAWQIVKFFAVTAFGLYVLQTVVIAAFTKWMDWPSQLVTWFLKVTGLKKYLKSDFVLKNGAKLAATLVSLIWNYLLYKKFVYMKG